MTRFELCNALERISRRSRRKGHSMPLASLATLDRMLGSASVPKQDVLPFRARPANKHETLVFGDADPTLVAQATLVAQI
jgi:hypothetical protein